MLPLCGCSKVIMIGFGLHAFSWRMTLAPRNRFNTLSGVACQILPTAGGVAGRSGEGSEEGL